MIGKLFGKGKSGKASSADTSVGKSVATEAASHASDKNAGAKAARSRKSHGKKPRQKAAETWSVEQFKVAPAEGKTRFHDLGLDDRLMHGIADLGFEYCSPIQAGTLPQTMQGQDAIGKAQTGTGKTAAFLITIISDFLANPIEEERYAGEPRALIIAPTRELVVQIGEDAKSLNKYTGLKVATLIGGMDYQKQLQQLNRELVDIVVATPGRLLDFQSRGDLYLDQVEILVIDEADRMLDMGFIPQVRRIVRSTPRRESRQTLLFSATFTPEVISLTEQWTFEPFSLEIEPDSVATDTVDQKVYIVSADQKFALLRNIVQLPEAKSVIVFANRRDQTRKLYERLRKAGIRCGILSGEIPCSVLKTAICKCWLPRMLRGGVFTLTASVTWLITPCPKTRKIMCTALVAPEEPVPVARQSVLPAKMIHSCWRHWKKCWAASCLARNRRKTC